REQAEEILKQSESLYRTLAEAAQDIIFIIDESDIIHYANNFAAQMIGKTPKGLVGEKQAALFPPEIAVVQSEHVRQVLCTGEPQYIVTHGNFPQGEMWLGTWLVPTRVDNGTVPAVMGVSRNITDDKINQERLQELLESYQKLFEAFPYGAMLITFSGTPVFMNRRMEEILAKPQQLLWREMGPKDVYPELNDREELLRVIEQNGGRVENYPMTYRRLDGETFPAEISVEPVQYLGRNLRLVCLQDVTQRQRVEEAMRLAELHWSQFLEAAPDLMWIKDLSGRYLAANQMYLDTEKRAASELIGLTDAEVYPSEDAAVYQYTDQVAIKGGVSEGEFLRKLQEELRIFWVKKVPLHTPDGKISGILGLARDVTEWKRVENALRETESQFRLLFDESPVPLWQMDLSAVRRLIEDLLLQGIPNVSAYFNDQPNELVRLLNCKHLVRVNKEGLRLFDASSIEELEAGFSSLFPPESIPCVQAGLEALLAGQGEYQAEIPVCTLTGEARFAAVRLVLSPGSEASWQNTLLSFQDVTARHQAEQALRKSEERLEETVHDRTVALEKTNVALKVLAQKLVETQETERREIARELHDDIGQELTGLKLLLERSYRKAPTELKSSLKGADGLVSGILTKIRDMALNLRPSMLDDLGLLPALLYQFERFTTHTHIEIKFQHIGVEIRFPPEIETAAFRIIQEALTNVARHAKTSEAWITVAKQGEELWLTVKDQGVGFDPEQELAGGDSTGLKGIRERVSAIGGSFVLESTPGCGSLLKVQLPLWEKELDPTT
ncbi:MAG: PAS domain S-box protein, partial [Coprothermobacterota bacterium]|nr:PAS domain S-box protein [Coprothermobacterota bacterium]